MMGRVLIIVRITQNPSPITARLDQPSRPRERGGTASGKKGETYGGVTVVGNGGVTGGHGRISDRSDRVR